MSDITPEKLEFNLSRLAELSSEQVLEQYQIERKAIACFQGPIDELEAALGLLHIGHHFGWKPLVLLHNKRTIRKYEEILGINIREVFPEEGPSCERLRAYKIVKKIGNFWKAVSGELKDEELKEARRNIE